MTSLGAVLEQFPDEVIVYITDPRSGGIQRRSKWPPTISEVIEAGEQHQEHLERMRRPRPVIIPRLSGPLLDTPDGAWARIFVPEGHIRYDSLVKWAETAEKPYWKYGHSSDSRRGIWVSLDAWESRNQKGQ